MIEYSLIKCTGCEACVNTCPVNAIRMEPNSEGFLYPVIEPSICNSCNKCDSVCQINGNFSHDVADQQLYAAVNQSRNDLLESSSGGVFSTLADYIVHLDGIIFGCSFDNALTAKHSAATAEDGYARFRGSKYVQSSMGDTYQQVEQHLKNDKYVLFTGTPCQVEGLNCYLGKAYDKLITVDLICHGVPSPELWKRHISWLERKAGKRIISYRFRGKYRVGWSLYYYYYYEGLSQPEHGISRLDPYYTSFLAGENYRESCYQCKYANMRRPSDFTIGDYWGCSKYHKEVNPHNGVSLLLVNTKKAMSILPLLEKLELNPTKVEWVLHENRNLVEPTKRPNRRDGFYQDVLPDVQKWEEDFRRTSQWRMVKLKSMVPIKLKTLIKRVLRRGG